MPTEIRSANTFLSKTAYENSFTLKIITRLLAVPSFTVSILLSFERSCLYYVYICIFSTESAFWYIMFLLLSMINEKYRLHT